MLKLLNKTIVDRNFIKSAAKVEAKVERNENQKKNVRVKKFQEFMCSKITSLPFKPLSLGIYGVNN